MKTLKKNITFKVNGEKINHTNFENLPKEEKEKVYKSNPNWFDAVLVPAEESSKKTK